MGLLLWSTLIYLSIKSATFTWKNSTDLADSNVGFGVVLAILGYIVSAMFVTLEYETFYLLLAFGTVLGRQGDAVQLSRREIKIILISVGLLLLLLQLFVVAYMS